MTVKVIRQLNGNVSSKLKSGESFFYAHLVKFEKPIKTDTGAVAYSQNDYSYLTDASHNIIFDDGSENSKKVQNGSQTYVAQRLIKVGQVSETTQAKATAMSITIDGTALNTSFAPSKTTVNATTSTITITEDWIKAGFSEGDKLRISSGDSNDGEFIIITAFQNNNTVIKYNNIIDSSSANDTSYNFNVETEEHSSLFMDKGESSYSAYVNREVFVYKALINPETGAVIGQVAPSSGNSGYPEGELPGPFLIFKGIIASASVKEDGSRNSDVTWTLTSHWGDFVSVNGRVTSDTEHRGINGLGNSDYAALIRPEYVNDYGFLHSEQAINLISTYKATETRYRFKKTGVFGMGSGRTEEYEVEVEREIELKFNLDARRLPVVYGVNRLDSFPIFVDLDKTSTNDVYAAYAICEGEIAGLYDIYFDNQGRICADAADSSARTSNESVSVLCEGRKDRGDTLTAKEATDESTTVIYYGGPYSSVAAPDLSSVGGPQWQRLYNDSIGSQTNSRIPAVGVMHEDAHDFSTPIGGELIFHSGKPNQKANNLLTNMAKDSKFYVQSQYFDATTEKADYWGPNHRLLDTAYVVAHYTITEEDLEIPSIDFVVRGRILPCFNYDFAYRPDYKRTGSNATPQTFQLGQSVTIHKTSNNALLHDGITIADYYTYYDQDCNNADRSSNIYADTGAHPIWRFASEPTLNGETEFYMKDGSGNKWHFVTHDHQYMTKTSVTKDTTSGTGITYTAGASGNGIDIELPNTTQGALIAAILDYCEELAPVYSSSAGEEVQAKAHFGTFSLRNDDKSSKVDSGNARKFLNVSTFEDGWTTDNVPQVRAPKAIIIPGGNTTENYYVGSTIELTRTNADGTVAIQKRRVVKSKEVSSNVVAVVDHDWDVDNSGDFTLAPTIAASLSGSSRIADTFIITVKSDERVTINPAMQLLDYITNKRYGKGLDLEKDIDLDSFKTVARLCDTRSDVSIIVPSATSCVLNDVYKYANSDGTLLWQGTVKTISSTITYDGATYKEITFTDCIGKLIKKWFDWQGYNPKDLLYNSTLGRAFISGTTSYDQIDIENSAPTYISSLTLNRISGSGASTLSPYLGSFSGQGAAATGSISFEGNPLVKSFGTDGFTVNGYSLYDSDDVKYWRYMGWQSQNQREVTRHQACPVLDTNTSVFENINSLLAHFNGILRYSNGKYELDIQSGSTLSSYGNNDTRIIKENDIIGAIAVEDDGTKGSKNTVSVNFPDPQQEYGSRSVTYFNSTYLAEDRNIPRKHDVKTPHILNYYNARINAKQYLDQSRYGKKVNFIMEPKGSLLLAGTIIQVSYPRFGWGSDDFTVTTLSAQTTTTLEKHGFKVGDIIRYEGITAALSGNNKDNYNDKYFTVSAVSADGYSFTTDQPNVTAINSNDTNIYLGIVHKKGHYFRISNLNFREDCSVQVTALEHNDESYLITKRRSDVKGGEPGTPGQAAPNPPTNVAAVGLDQKITVTWDNNAECYNADGTWNKHYFTEIYRNNSIGFNTQDTNFEIGPSGNKSKPFATGANRVPNGNGLVIDQDFTEYTPEGSGAQTRYHWVRHIRNTLVKGTTNKYVDMASAWAPLHTANGVSATATGTVTVRTAEIEARDGIIVRYNGLDRDGTDDLTFKVTIDGFGTSNRWYYRYYTSDMMSNEAPTHFIKDSTAAKSNDTTSDQYKGKTYWNGSTNTQSYDIFNLHQDWEPKSPADSVNGTRQNVTLHVQVFEITTAGIQSSDSPVAQTQISLSSIDLGKPGYNVSLPVTSWTFVGNSSNVASATGFTCLPSITRNDPTGTTQLSYQPYSSSLSGTDLANSWSYNVTNGTDENNDQTSPFLVGVVGTNCTPINTNGTITINSNSTFLQGAAGEYADAKITLYFKDNKRIRNALLTGTQTDIQTGVVINLHKVPLPVRDGLDVYVNVSNTSDLSDADYAAWATDTIPNTTAGNAAVDAAAKYVANESKDKKIRPNDVLHMSKGAAGAAKTVSRIYQGSMVALADDANMASVAISDWSSIVTNTFDGSVIVDGTLRAETLQADSSFINNLSVEAELKVGDGGNAGTIRSHTKTAWLQSGNGFWFGHDGKVWIGDHDNYLKFDPGNGTSTGGTFSVGGNLSVAGQAARQVTLYAKNYSSSNNLPAKPTSSVGSYSDPRLNLTGSDWSYAQPEITANGDTIWSTSRTFVSHSGTTVSQDADWSTPQKIAERVDGATITGADGITYKEVHGYQKQANGAAASGAMVAQGNFTTPIANNLGWSTAIPSLTANGDIVYVQTRIFKSVGDPDANWSTPVIYSRRTDGVNGTGTAGSPGAAFYVIAGSGSGAPNTQNNFLTSVDNQIGRDYVVVGDICVITYLGTSYPWRCTGASGTGTWTAQAAFIEGGLIVAGGIGTDKLDIVPASGNSGIFFSVGGGNVAGAQAVMEIKENNQTRVKLGYIA